MHGLIVPRLLKGSSPTGSSGRHFRTVARTDMRASDSGIIPGPDFFDWFWNPPEWAGLSRAEITD
jgi:hypothetical protein